MFNTRKGELITRIAMHGLLGALSGFLPALASLLGSAIFPSPAPWGNLEPILALMLFGSIGLVLGLIGGAASGPWANDSLLRLAHALALKLAA